MKKISLIILLAISLNINAQDIAKPKAIISQIETLLKYREKSPTQLRTLLIELKKHIPENSTEYQQLKIRVDKYLLPIDIKLVRSDIYNKNFRRAIEQTQTIKLNNPYNKTIENLEIYLDKKLYRHLKQEFLSDKPSIFSIEPSISLISQEVRFNEFSELGNMNTLYSLGFYYKFKNEMLNNYKNKPTFKYSQVGLKFDYRDTLNKFFTMAKNPHNSPYINGQLSFIFNRFFEFDLGVLKYNGKSAIPNQSSMYTANIGIHIPGNTFSIGVHSKFISDLNDTNPFVQLGASIKFNIGVYKLYTTRDKEEIKSQVLKMKNI